MVKNQSSSFSGKSSVSSKSDNDKPIRSSQTPDVLLHSKKTINEEWMKNEERRSWQVEGSYLQKNGKRSAIDIKRRNVRNLHCFRGIALERDP